MAFFYCGRDAFSFRSDGDVVRLRTAGILGMRHDKRRVNDRHLVEAVRENM